ncbi:hypothetical protein KBD59_01970 [Candidatus Gracilibacteria bacterium]|nr:hypothetical protein [Candidatus Gracilibacteria bacterium]
MNTLPSSPSVRQSATISGPQLQVSLTGLNETRISAILNRDQRGSEHLVKAIAGEVQFKLLKMIRAMATTAAIHEDDAEKDIITLGRSVSDDVGAKIASIVEPEQQQMVVEKVSKIGRAAVEWTIGTPEVITLMNRMHARFMARVMLLEPTIQDFSDHHDITSDLPMAVAPVEFYDDGYSEEAAETIQDNSLDTSFAETHFAQPALDIPAFEEHAA